MWWRHGWQWETAERGWEQEDDGKCNEDHDRTDIDGRISDDLPMGGME